MIKQTKVGLETRTHANPYYIDGFLPLITSNMYSVVGEENYELFLKNKINVALPRGCKTIKNNNTWNSFTISEFETLLETDNFESTNILIDCANGNNPKLHSLIERAKAKYGESIKIMSGNVSSVEAFIELANSGCDYIRVGVGGSSSCNTTKNTGVGQHNLGQLIERCYNFKEISLNINKNVKIVADGISNYVTYCSKEYGFLDNGYAAINKLLNLGADYIMIGKLFAQCTESSGEKTSTIYGLKVNYQGMSTKEAQSKYNTVFKHSEGNSALIDVKWGLEEWLNGSLSEPDYLPGFINCLKSAMAYVGTKEIEDFKGE